MTLVLRYAARSDVGLVRSNNEDSVYAGARLLALADGMGGHAAGEVASQLVIAALAHLDDDEPGGDLLASLDSAVHSGNSAIAAQVEMEPDLEGMGTTLTAILFAGNRIGMVHIGDSRGYLLRDGELTQITKDDTFVQTLVDEGRITKEEAHSHPQRSLIMRALTGHEVEPTLTMREVRLGDRYLLCSDGLSDPVSDETILDALKIPDVTDSADRLIELALRGGGPDNVTVVVADVVDNDYGPTQPIIAGAVSGDSDVHDQLTRPNTSAGRASALNPAQRSRQTCSAANRYGSAGAAVAAADADRARAGDPADTRGARHRPDGDPQLLLRHRLRRRGVDHAGHPGVHPGYAAAPAVFAGLPEQPQPVVGDPLRHGRRQPRLPADEAVRPGRVGARPSGGGASRRHPGAGQCATAPVGHRVAAAAVSAGPRPARRPRQPPAPTTSRRPAPGAETSAPQEASGKPVADIGRARPSQRSPRRHPSRAPTAGLRNDDAATGARHRHTLVAEPAQCRAAAAVFRHGDHGARRSPSCRPTRNARSAGSC